MSFILDALRKSENERQRDSVPDLARIPIAQAPPTVPVWSWILIGALGVAAVGLGTAWWQSSQQALPDMTARELPRETLQSDAAAVTVDPAPPVRSDPAPPPPAASVAVVRAAPAASPPPAVVEEAPRQAVPSLSELLATGMSLPELRLELLVYHELPAGRFAFINGGRYGEGQRLPSGPTVREILPEGVILSQEGREFLLLPQ